MTHTPIEKTTRLAAAYQSILDNLPCAVYRCRMDEERTMEVLTDKIEEITGYAATDLIQNASRCYADLIDSEDKDAIRNEIEQSAKRSEPFSIEYRLRHKDGKVRWVFEKGVVVTNEAGQPAFIDGTITEITERKTTEQSLQRRERYVSALAEVERRLLRGRSVEENLHRVLEILGKAANADRVYVFENFVDAAGELCTSQKAEWCNVGIKSELNNPQLQALAYKLNFGRWKKLFERGQAVTGAVREFPEEERAVLEPSGIQAIAVFPIIAHEKLYGFIGFDNCISEREWGESELGFLRGAASALSLSLERERLDKEMREAKEQLEAVLEAMPGYVSWIDKSMRYLGVNRQLAHALNRAPQDFIGEQVGFMNSKFTQFVKSFIESERQNAIGEVSLEVDGYAATQLVAAQKYMQGNAAVFVGIDITKRKQAEEADRKSREQLNALLQGANVGILLQGPNAEILKSNPAAWELLGLTEDQLLGKTSFDPSWNVIKEDGSPFPNQDHPVPKAIATKQAVRGVVMGVYRPTTQNRVWLLVDAVPQIDASGHVHQVVCTFTNITETIAAQEKLREQAALLDVTRDAVLLLDIDSRILYLNRSAEKLYGWTSEEAVGKFKKDLAYRGNEAFYFDKIHHEALQTGSWRGELVQYAKDGRKIIVDSRRTVIKGKDGQPEKILVVNTDITEAKQLQNQMLRNQRMDSVGMLASGIAHDMNNILSPITASLMLLKSKQTDEKSLRWIEMLESNTQRGAELMRQVLSFARGESTERTVFNVMHLIKDIEMMSAQTFPKSIEFKVSAKKGLWSLFGDPVQLHQVLMNLAVNARDAMPNGGSISISAENVEIDETNVKIHVDAKVGAYLKLTVSDTGSGIAPEHLERIFDPFFTTKPVGKGTGLGLAIVFSIVRSFGGFVGVESRVGEGTTFTIYLPALKSTESASEKEPTNDVKAQTGGETILLVEDEDLVREIAHEILKNAGYVVIPARNGVEAVELYEQRQADIQLLLTDLMMPKMDGLACIREIRKIKPDLPVVAMSGVMDGDKVARLKHIGVDKTVAKPYSGERLLAAVREALTKTNGYARL